MSEDTRVKSIMEQMLLRHESQLTDLRSKVDVMQGQIGELQARVAELERIVSELVIASLRGEQLKTLLAGLTADEYNRLVARQLRRIEFMEAEHATR